MDIFTKSQEQYRFHHNSQLGGAAPIRLKQIETITDILRNNFPFKTINCIETGASQNWFDGMVGYYFAYLANDTQGTFHSVDNDPSLEQKTIDAYLKIDSTLKINHITDDSINFLQNVDIIPNLIHLDSWDLDLENPFPSALHGWREFEAIESRMPIGSIIIVDDNFFGGTFQEWFYHDNDTGKLLGSKIIDITYPIIGKGSHIYQYAERDDTNWNILSKGGVGNQKIVIQKIN
tara:strand:+ start:290 stop:991 length:702 start_codon:yes stop_codon:yes gene_type:complete